ncbi:immunoglobulin kappa light chain-like [Thunnus thynnus]|uniref:immunoglobulin kappa light chain-like n=1 Tax=Thunnus thynnus TaxID=8237 RepID=UPI003526D87D
MLLHFIWMMMLTFHTGSSEDLLKPFKDVMLALEGDNVTLSCKYSGSVRNLYWYQQKYSSSPQLLIMENSEKEGLSLKHDKENETFHLQISSAAVSDSAVYYCALQPTVTGNTFGGGTRLDVGSDVRPTLTVLPPSSEELQQGKATLICLANKGFPSDWSLAWKVDGSSSSSSGEESRSPGVLQKDGCYSWSSTLRLPADQWRKVGSVTCEATQGSQTPVSETLRRDQCSQS